MATSPKPEYILGTGLSHDGSACILKDGKIAVAIEKERITRVKHDGGNDAAAVQYCLDALGIAFTDLALVVQAANFEKDIAPDRYMGARIHHPDVPVVTISHHLAHAYSAIATSPFAESNVLVIDGAGSPVSQCDDWPDAATRAHWEAKAATGMYCEKDSFYHYDGHTLRPLYKDFSVAAPHAAAGALRMPVTRHSIGGLYAAASHYCFGNMDDAGKLMGLAPYGGNTFTGTPLYRLEEGNTTVLHEALEVLQQPAADYAGFKSGFQHYADVARWVQEETERAIAYVAAHRMALHPHRSLCYAGGVALNAVSNAALLRRGIVKNLYLQPAAGDNGLAPGCAYYGWHQVMQRAIPHGTQPSVFFGRRYSGGEVAAALEQHPRRAQLAWQQPADVVAATAAALAAGSIVGWYQEGAEFGPRALGHRSILADPRLPGIQQRINSAVKFREDFRPFAPAVPEEDVALYFKHGWDSPYMILVDEIRDEWREALKGVVHVNGTCRVQTVAAAWNGRFHALLQQFKQLTGISVLINTSFNRKGMPIVETPGEALDFFLDCALDVLVLDDYVVTKCANGQVTDLQAGTLCVSF